MKKNDMTQHTIALNKKAYHDYFIEEKYEAGLVLEGWEVKSLRAGRVNLTDGYILLKAGEAFLIGAHITPLPTASTHIHPDPARTRKLLLKHAELRKLIGQIERKGYTLIPLSLYWHKNRVKVLLGLSKGKKQHDKRAAIKDREWEREKARLLKR